MVFGEFLSVDQVNIGVVAEFAQLDEGTLEFCLEGFLVLGVILDDCSQVLGPEELLCVWNTVSVRRCE